MFSVNGNPIMQSEYNVLVELRRQATFAGLNIFKDIKESGNDLMVTCPFHKGGQERKPSFGINKSTMEAHCFTCGYSGNLYDVISRIFGYDDRGQYGKSWLSKNFVSITVEERKPIELNLTRKRIKNEVKTNYVTEEELDRYRYTHPYMYKRGLTDELISKFDIGYDAATACITFPVRDIRGNCVFLARRSVNYKYFNYPSGNTKGLYGIFELYQIKRFPSKIYVCESMLDALTLWSHNVYACALNGLGTSLQFKQLRDMPCRHFVLATDNDKAGMQARQHIRENLSNKIITQVMLPNGRKDINECSWEEIEALEEVF